MSVQLHNPQFLIDEVAKYGVTLAPVVEFEGANAIQKVDDQFRGVDASFGCDDMVVGIDDADFGSFLRHFIGKKADRKIRNTAKTVGKGIGKGLKVVAPVAAIASFAIPGAGLLVGPGALAALAAADKLVGDKNIKNAAKVINNTKALAALGDPGAKRGVMVLSAVSKIRAVNKVPPGKKAIPYKPPVIAKNYTQVTARAKVQTLAAKKVTPVIARKTAIAARRPAPKPAPKRVVTKPKVSAAAKLSFWAKVKQLFT